MSVGLNFLIQLRKMLKYILPAAALIWYMSTRTPAGVPTQASAAHGKDAARGVTMKCQEKYCPPTYQIHVDTPKNTLTRDDSLRRGLCSDQPNIPAVTSQSLGEVYDSTKAQYYKEAHQHPGVRLVAHTVS